MIFNTKCRLCNEGRVPLFGAIKIQIAGIDGTKTIRICNECASTMEALRLLKDGKELREDKIQEDERTL